MKRSPRQSHRRCTASAATDPSPLHYSGSTAEPPGSPAVQSTVPGTDRSTQAVAAPRGQSSAQPYFASATTRSAKRWKQVSSPLSARRHCAHSDLRADARRNPPPSPAISRRTQRSPLRPPQDCLPRRRIGTATPPPRSYSTQVDVLASNEVALARQKKVDYVRDVLHLPEAGNGLPFQQTLHFALGHGTDEIGLHRRRPDGIDGDAIGSQLASHVLCLRFVRGFGGRVVRF